MSKAGTGVRTIEVRRADGTGIDLDSVAVEEPLEIRLGYSDGERRQQSSISITMRTPGHDVELAVGFLLTEGIISEAGAVMAARNYGPDGTENGAQNVVQVELTDQTVCDIERLRRNYYTTSSCGVCGKASLDALYVQGGGPINDDNFRISAETLKPLPDRLREQQANFAITGGIHAAAAFDSSGKLGQLFEDVGRHNALDKLIGATLLGEELPLIDRGILVSGRASFELLQKAMMAGCPLLAAVGAPSSLAIAAATEFNMTLIGFLNQRGFNIYTGEKRVQL
jgi:FdhD protein